MEIKVCGWAPKWILPDLNLAVRYRINIILCMHYVCIIESVDSISRDGPDIPICIIHYKMPKHSPKTKFKVIKLSYL